MKKVQVSKDTVEKLVEVFQDLSGEYRKADKEVKDHFLNLAHFYCRELNEMTLHQRDKTMITHFWEIANISVNMSESPLQTFINILALLDIEVTK